MTVSGSSQPVARGLVASDGALMQADPWLAELNARAGGRIGSALAVPQLALIARLARQLETPISRAAIAADGDHDVELWVRAEPGPDSVCLALTGWRTRLAEVPETNEETRAVDDVRSGSDWLWETDAALHLTYVSIASQAHDGRDVHALLGEPLTRLFAIDAANEDEPPILRALALHESFHNQPAVVRSTGRAVHLAATPRFSSSGQFAGFIGAARTQVDAASNQATNAFGSRLERALRGPLGAIIANANAIHDQVDGSLADTYVDYASDIAAAGRHLLGLVDDLVDLQAVERSDFRVERAAIDLADLARRAAGLLQVRASAKQVQIDYPAASETLGALGEFRRVLQILVNLIGNAVRYSPPGSVVCVRVEQDDQGAMVIVADQGKGIAEDDKARIFEKFQRVDPREPGGSGLGLYISQRLARAMAGTISVDSTLGQGARFTLRLPAQN